MSARSRAPWTLLMLLALLAGPAAAQDGGIELVDGSSIDIPLPSVGPGQAVAVSELFIDVPANAESLRVDLLDATDRDVDVLLARTPFPIDSGDIGALFGHAEYFSGGTGGEEFVTILDSVTPAVDGERWQVLVLAFTGPEGTARLDADIRFGAPEPAQFEIDFANTSGLADCDTSPWNDSSPFTPGNGNNATTLGEARRNAMTEAARLISQQLSSPTSMIIRACWYSDEENEDGGATLASARSNLIFSNTPGLKDANIAHVQAVVTRRAGTSVCRLDASIDCNEEDVFIRFNRLIDTDQVFGSVGFYYGFTGASGNDIDFVDTAVHEITHGLGFVSLYGENGSSFLSSGIPDAFTVNLIDNSGTEPVRLTDSSTTNAQRASAFTSGIGLAWTGSESSVSNGNPFATIGDGYVQMHAPNPYQPGSSVSHLASNYCALMRFANSNCEPTGFRGLGIEQAMLHEVGWAPESDTPPALGLYFDRSRDGHGFELQAGGVDPELGRIYVLTFYSYESLFNVPEWFQAVGYFDDGAFQALRTEVTAGWGLPTFLYDAEATPPQQGDPSRNGQVAFTFNDAENSEACNDGVDRGNATVGVFQWAIDSLKGEWCVELVPGTETRPAADFGGLWFAGPEDGGWGYSLENIQRADGSIDLFVLLYVYASDGTPVWYLGAAEDIDPTQPVDITMLQRRGFGRGATPSPTDDEVAGVMTLVFGDDPVAGLDGSNRVSVDVTYQGNEGGDWVRVDVPVIRLSVPRD